MANYLIISCADGSSFTTNDGGNILVIGNIYYLSGETIDGCFTIDSLSSDPPTTTATTVSDKYTNCLTCYQNNEWSYLVSACTISDLGGPVNATQFNQDPTGQFYKICAPEGEFDGCLCFQVLGPVQTNYPPTFIVNGPYSNCECEITPRSANTENFICIPDCEFTGSTAVSPPHPVWTDGYGTAVTQLNMITLGGPNGLNA